MKGITNCMQIFQALLIDWVKLSFIAFEGKFNMSHGNILLQIARVLFLYSIYEPVSFPVNWLVPNARTIY